ncbi:hypothetical protein SAMN05216227_10297 [Pseudorhodobacter antarcticus]|uniref:Uncharacterized protein n=1 Tax=Pseudorhodobacter antarcticus TaxID=1077947 RepID=A0A1H8K3W9_9RHOB|nr:hypothetical protein SAMN05216227_10297 [Pseudorhodobacter antarcticus]
MLFANMGDKNHANHCPLVHVNMHERAVVGSLGGLATHETHEM